MNVRRYPDAEAVAEAAAELVALAATEAIASRGVFRLALAGGSTPKKLYRRLREVTVDWPRVEIFFGDERAVGPADEASNYRMAREALLEHVALQAARVHRIEGERGAAEAARRYEATMGDEPLDLVLLGMGADGHTASLFPAGALGDGERRVIAVRGPPPHVERVSLTVAAIGEARAAAFLVTGADKAETLARALAEARAGAPRLPAARIRARSPVTWLVDEAAARGLDIEESEA